MSGEDRQFYFEMCEKIKSKQYEWLKINKSEFGSKSYNDLIKEFLNDGFKVEFNEDSTSARISL